MEDYYQHQKFNVVEIMNKRNLGDNPEQGRVSLNTTKAKDLPDIGTEVVAETGGQGAKINNIGEKVNAEIVEGSIKTESVVEQV